MILRHAPRLAATLASAALLAALAGASISVSVQGGGTPVPQRPPRLEGAKDLSGIRLAPPPKPVPAPAAQRPVSPESGFDVPPVAAPPVPSGPRPRIAWIEGGNIKDFGNLLQGQVVEHTFSLENAGEGDLVITQAKGSCSCTVAQVTRVGDGGARTPYNYGEAIKPGDTFEIGVRIDTHSKRDAFRGQVSIYSNEPRSVVQLEVSAQIQPYLLTEPQFLSLDRMTSVEKRSGTAIVSSPVVERFSLQVEPGLPPELSVELVPREIDAQGRAKEWEARVVLGPNAPEGMYVRAVRLISDQAIAGAAKLPDGADAMHEISLSVSAQVQGMVTVEPGFVSFGLLRPGQVASRTVKVTCNDPNFSMPAPELVMKALQGGPYEYADSFSTLVRPVVDGKSYDVEITANGLPDTLNGTFLGVLEIRPGHPSRPSIDLRFTGVCRTGVAVPQPQPPTPPPGGGR